MLRMCVHPPYLCCTSNVPRSRTSAAQTASCAEDAVVTVLFFFSFSTLFSPMSPRKKCNNMLCGVNQNNPGDRAYKYRVRRIILLSILVASRGTYVTGLYRSRGTACMYVGNARRPIYVSRSLRSWWAPIDREITLSQQQFVDDDVICLVYACKNMLTDALLWQG